MYETWEKFIIESEVENKDHKKYESVREENTESMFTEMLGTEDVYYDLLLLKIILASYLLNVYRDWI